MYGHTVYFVYNIIIPPILLFVTYIDLKIIISSSLQYPRIITRPTIDSIRFDSIHNFILTPSCTSKKIPYTFRKNELLAPPNKHRYIFIVNTHFSFSFLSSFILVLLYFRFMHVFRKIICIFKKLYFFFSFLFMFSCFHLSSYYMHYS